MKHHFRLGTLTVALLLAASTTACQSKSLPEKVADATEAPPPAQPLTPEQKTQAQRSAMDLSRMQLIDDRCHWLDKTSRVAIDATTAERQALLNEFGPEWAIPAKDAAANVALAGTTNCADATAVQGIRYAAWQMRVTWALRAQALLDGADRPAWFAQQSPTLPYRPALTETLSAINEKYSDSVETAGPGIQAEAIRMLALTCPNAPHQCPVDPTGGAQNHGKAYAQVWVQQATKFAEALAQDPIKLPPVPQPGS